MNTLTAHRVSFRHADLDQLSADEKCVLMQAGIVLTDLRFFDQQLLLHIRFLRKEPKLHEMEIGVFLSQITLLFSQLAGTLCEAHNVIRKSYYSPSVSRKYASSLSSEAKAALSRIRNYFAKGDNLASVIRN